MSGELMSESNEPILSDADSDRIEEFLTFWFKEQNLSAPQIDGRMELDVGY